MIDSHTHLNLDPLLADWQSYYSQALAKGVSQMLVVGVTKDSSLEAIKQAEGHQGIYASVGLHPEEAANLIHHHSTQELLSWLCQTASQPKVIALGETGLDYYRISPESQVAKQERKSQRKLFKLHLRAAKDLDKPVVIHMREAQAEMLELLTEYRPKAVLHCYSGDADYLKECLKLGMMVSFAGNVTFSNAVDLQEQLKLVPLDRLLLETDAPYLNPQRGHWPNSPAQVALTYEFVAKHLGVELSKLESQLAHNFTEFFKVKLPKS